MRGEKKASSLIPLEPHLVILDQEKLAFPLQVRYFQAGDRFWPLGAPGPRKLQDFLVDAKIPRWLRSRQTPTLLFSLPAFRVFPE